MHRDRTACRCVGGEGGLRNGWTGRPGGLVAAGSRRGGGSVA